MKYKINGFLFYDVIAGSLSTAEKNQVPTKLSITANALLYYLIQNPGVLTRDELLKKVWDDNGLVSSNSNLNQYICLLRKSFRQYGIENVITTIPKKRLEISTTLDIERIDSDMLYAALPLQVKDNESTKNELYQVKKTLSNFWCYASFVVFFLSFCLLISAVPSTETNEKIPLFRLPNQSCELFSIDKLINKQMTDNKINNFNAVKSKLNLSCGKDVRFLFFYRNKLESKGLGRTFLAHCTGNKRDPYEFCESYFYYSWK